MRLARPMADVIRNILLCPFLSAEEQEMLSRVCYRVFYAALDGLPTRWSGRYLLGHLTYTEIRWWGQKTLATPNGRHSGDVRRRRFASHFASVTKKPLNALIIALNHASGPCL